MFLTPVASLLQARWDKTSSRSGVLGGGRPILGGDRYQHRHDSPTTGENGNFHLAAVHSVAIKVAKPANRAIKRAISRQ